MGRLFGTDGARGVAVTELTCELAMNIGRAAAVVLTRELSHRPKILIGKDTRISCDILESALVAGICSVGADAHILGVLPTPGVAMLVREYKADAGVMISASHNSVEFNGIKLFSSSGYKLPDSLEEEIEALVLDTPELVPLKDGVDLGRVYRIERAAEDYCHRIAGFADCTLEGLKIAIDCAEGSASVTAAKIFRGLGAECLLIHGEPDGTNINDRCGSTHMDVLTEFVVKNHCDVGIAFDGDADRCLAVDEKGNLVDGDKIMAICAADLKSKGRLAKNTAVVTVMSNMGFTLFCREHDIDYAATKVGDRYVLEEMLAKGFVLGGEQSGHVIFLENSTTGDGQLTAVKLLSILKSSKKSFSELASVMTALPQVLENVTIPLSYKGMWSSDEAVSEVIKKVESALGGNGRLLVRESGTEPLIRVMAEGRDESEIKGYVMSIVDVIKSRF